MLMQVSELNRLFDSLLNQFVSSFARVDVLASFEFDDWFIDFSFSIASFEGQVCYNAEYDCMFWAIGMAVAPGRMLGNFLPIHDADSLPLYRMGYLCWPKWNTLCAIKRAVHTHMSKSKMCKGGESKRITVMTRPCDVIAGGSGGMRPCPPPQHQPPGIYLSYT